MRLISVLMPAYNAGKYIGEAIQSILNQTYIDFELIIIDDGSSDDTAHQVEYYAKSDRRIKFFQQTDNRGIVYTRNRLIALARGNFIAWMDSDDISYPKRLEVMAHYMRSHPDCAAVGCGTVILDPEGMEIGKWNQPEVHEEIDKWHISGRGGAIVFPSSMMRLDIVKNVGGFQEGLVGAEDLDLFLRIAETGKLFNTKSIMFGYRQHTESISHIKQEQILENTYDVIVKACLRRGIINKVIKIERYAVQDTYQHHTRWAWWALAAGNTKTARKHAWIAFRLSPFSLESYKVLACSIRGF